MAQAEGRPTILVVEDDAALRALMVRMLSGGGYTTVATGSASEGLEIVRQHHGQLALAILDIVIPGMSGLDLATDLDREYPDLKILYTSGYVHSVAADVLSRRTPDRMLLKPFTREVLLDRVQLLLRSAEMGEPSTEGQKPATNVGSGN